MKPIFTFTILHEHVAGIYLVGGVVLAANHRINVLAVLDCINFVGCAQLIMLMMYGENKLMSKVNLKWQGN
jgi:hypothetical protein